MKARRGWALLCAQAAAGMVIGQSVAYGQAAGNEYYWLGYEGVRTTDPQAACATYNEFYTQDGYTLDRVENPVVSNGMVRCNWYFQHTVNSWDKYSRNKDIRRREGVIVPEEPEETCASQEGNNSHVEFTYNLDGPAPNMAGAYCVNGCSLEGEIKGVTEYDNEFGDWEAVAIHYTGDLTYTGDECGDSPPDPPPGSSWSGADETPNDPPSCTSDYYTSPATGQIVCGSPAQTSTEQNGTETTTETADDGTKTTTVETPDGTTTTTTEHPDGSTTTTTVTSSGETTTDYESKPDKDDEDKGPCPSNQWQLVAGEMKCKTQAGDDSGDGTVSGGESCDVAPSCSGDPIMCAVVKQAWLQRCDGPDMTEDEILIGTGLDGNGTDAIQGETFEIAGSFDQTGFLSTTQCPVPLNISVASVSLDFSFDPLCTLAGYISPFVILSGLFAGARIVVGAF